MLPKSLLQSYRNLLYETASAQLKENHIMVTTFPGCKACWGSELSSKCQAPLLPNSINSQLLVCLTLGEPLCLLADDAYC